MYRGGKGEWEKNVLGRGSNIYKVFEEGVSLVSLKYGKNVFVEEEASSGKWIWRGKKLGIK